jgi:hypothetical protein
MTWTINGNLSEVRIIISKNGNIVIRGEGENTPYIYDDYVNSDYPATAEVLLRLQKAHADWRILSTDAVENEIIDNEAILNSIKAKPNKSIVEIKCFDDKTDEDPALSFNVALAPLVLEKVYDLFTKLIAGQKETQYSITSNFLVFRSPSAEVDIPTLEEFRTGRPYFCDEVSVSVRLENNKSA